MPAVAVQTDPTEDPTEDIEVKGLGTPSLDDIADEDRAEVALRTIDGSTTPLVIDLKWSVSMLKSLIALKTCIGASSQRLIHGGYVIKDGDVLREHLTEQTGHTIHVVQQPQPTRTSAAATAGSAAAGSTRDPGAGQRREPVSVNLADLPQITQILRAYAGNAAAAGASPGSPDAAGAHGPADGAGAVGGGGGAALNARVVLYNFPRPPESVPRILSMWRLFTFVASLFGIMLLMKQQVYDCAVIAKATLAINAAAAGNLTTAGVGPELEAEMSQWEWTNSFSHMLCFMVGIPVALLYIGFDSVMVANGDGTHGHIYEDLRQLQAVLNMAFAMLNSAAEGGRHHGGSAPVTENESSTASAPVPIPENSSLPDAETTTSLETATLPETAPIPEFVPIPEIL